MQKTGHEDQADDLFLALTPTLLNKVLINNHVESQAMKSWQSDWLRVVTVSNIT